MRKNLLTAGTFEAKVRPLSKWMALFVVLASLFPLSVKAQNTFDFASASEVAATPSGTGYYQNGVGTYYRNTSGSKVSLGNESCDGYNISASTANSLFIFKAEMDISTIAIRGKGTSSNRTFSDLAINSSVNLDDPYSSIAYTDEGIIGSPAASDCGEIVVTPASAIAAGTYMQLSFSGNLKVTSIVLTPATGEEPLEISNLMVVNHTSTWSVQSNIQLNDLLFEDRTVTINHLPDFFAGSDWVRTAVDSKAYTGDGTLATFEVNKDADVYVAHNQGIDPKPTWLQSWEELPRGVNEDNYLGFGTDKMWFYKKTFSGGSTVELGQNGNSVRAMYTVIVKPAETTTTSVENFPEKIVPNNHGAHVHLNSFIDYGMPENITAMDQFSNAGFSFARLVIPWFDVERTAGVYSFTNNQSYSPGYENAVQAFNSRGIRPIITLGFGNSLYNQSQGTPITTEEGLAAFANYCKAVARHFRDYNPIFEIWNEPNLATFGGYTGSEYVTLASRAKEGIIAGWHEGRESLNPPNPIVLGPAVANSWARGNMMDNCFDAGLLDIVDGISFHPYMNRNPTVSRRVPETMADAIASLRDELALRGKPDMPLVLTEWGWSTGNFDYEINEETQAKYHARQLLVGYYTQLEVNCIYSMADARNDDVRTENDKHYGMFTTMGGNFQKILTAKSSIDAVSLFNSSLSGYQFTERVNMGDSEPLNSANDWCLVFWNPVTDEAKVAVWTKDTNITKTSPDLKPLLNLSSSVVVDFTDSPVYVQISGYIPPGSSSRLTQDRDVDLIKSVALEENARKLTAYPNPASNKLTVTYPAASAGAILTVTDIMGKMLLRSAPGRSSSQSDFDIASLKPGVYLIKYENGEESTLTKFLKQ